MLDEDAACERPLSSIAPIAKRPAKQFSHRQSVQGSVLIIVMVVCIGLVSVALFFAHSTAMSYRGSTSDLAGRQAQRAVDGAAHYVEYLMTVSGSNNVAAGASSGSGTSASSGTNPPTNLLPDPTTYQSEAVPVGDATFWIIGEPQSSTTATSAVGTGSNIPSFGLVDEASKLNLNTASATMLQNLPNMTSSLAQAIVAWRQSGTSASGTSSTSSTTSSSSATSKGGPFESIYELAQVAQADGDDPSILYGNDTNLNHVMDGSESQGSGQYTPGIYEYVTAFSREPNTVLANGQARINVLTGSSATGLAVTPSGTAAGPTTTSGSSPTTLTGLLNSVFGETRAREIRNNLGIAPVSSVLAFYIRGKLTAAELDQITPYLTMSAGHYKSGLINVNTAGATVLACIPGITTQMASQIVSTRQTQATPYTNLAWLVPILGNTAAIQAGPYLTTESYQVTADIAATGPGGLGYRRTLFVIDASNGAPQIVYRHDMTPLGWALGPNALQSIGKQKVTTQ